MKQKLLPLEQLQSIREELRQTGRTVVQCHGCFDIVHPGHIRYLQFARQQGDVLVVSVSSDDVVGKGADRPYINQNLRMENLAALECVDYVCLDDNAWAGPVLEALRPDIYVKGKEYEASGDPRFVKEKQLVESYGGKVIFSSGDVVYSSTYILQQFRDRFPLEGERIRFFCRQHGIRRNALEALFARFFDLRVLVIGDPILDRYIHCDALGVAAESPILSVTPIRQDEFVGAGGLIARQIRALGGKAAFLTVLGRGAEADRFAAGLEGEGVELLAVRTDERPTYVKTRYLIDEKKVFKVDAGRHTPPSSVATQDLIRILNECLKDYDGVVVTDFGYGLFGRDLVDAIQEICHREGKPYFADVSHLGHANILKFKRPRLATPTEQELRFALADNESGLSNLASRYYRETRAERLVLTLSKRGLILFHPPERDRARLQADYLPAFSAHPVDPVGAGDVFLSALVLADLAGARAQWGVYLGSCVSAVHINHIGNDPVTMADLQDYLSEREELSG